MGIFYGYYEDLLIDMPFYGASIIMRGETLYTLDDLNEFTQELRNQYASKVQVQKEALP